MRHTANPNRPGGAAASALLAAVLLVAACAAPQPPAPVVEVTEVTGARSAEAGGDWARAAVLWEQASGETGGPDAATWMLNAAAAWLEGDQPERARTALERAAALGLPRDEQGREALLRGELALAAGDAEQAEFYLQAASERLPPGWRARLERDLRALEALRSDPHARTVAAAMDQLDRMLVYGTTAGVALLDTLEGLPSSRLRLEADSGSRLAPWAALSLAVRRALVQREDLLEASARWQADHPEHPVDATGFMELCWQYGRRFTPPARIAVLLPGEGGLQAAGEAIRDGIAAAFFENPAESELGFMPVTEDPLSVLSAWQRAADQGVQWVVGPLRRESVEAMVAQRDRPLPALALNWPEEAPPQTATSQPPLFGLSLSQQAEAESLADMMLETGHRRALMLLGDSEWAARMETAFTDRYLAGGGEIVGLDRFSAVQADHSSRLTELLRIEASRERRRRLQSTLGIPLEFEPTRRDDFEAIFLASGPELGRQLKPQLRFFDAGDKPVFAMSRVYTGRLNPVADQDLNGIVIPATRWMLRSEEDLRGAAELASLRGGTYGALHAIGRDAWGVLPWLGLMQRDPEFVYPGETGDLTVAPDGHLLREPVWARFEGGRPEPWTPPAPE